MEKITEIVIRGTRARIEVDGEVRGTLRKATLMDLGWQVGDDFDPEAWDAAQQGPEFRAALDEGARYLASARSRREVIRKLLSRDYLPDVAERAAERLESYGYIHDEDLAQRTVEAYAARGEGRMRIRQRLAHKGLEKDVAEQALESYDEEEEKQQALRMAQKLAPRYLAEDTGEGRRKLLAALTRRGFSWDAAGYALRTLETEEE